jgi:hypothetical protein
MARAVPFAFRDFGAPAAATASARPAADPIPAFTSADVEAAHALGVEKGAAEARSARDAESAARATAFARTLADLAAEFGTRRAADAAALRADAETAIAVLLRRTHRANAAEAALDLVARLLSASADRAKATLSVGDAALAEGLKREIAARGGADVVDVAVAGDLPPGDCRLAWRGGVAERRFATLRAELRRIFQTQDAAAAAREQEP